MSMVFGVCSGCGARDGQLCVCSHKPRLPDKPVADTTEQGERSFTRLLKYSARYSVATLGPRASVALFASLKRVRESESEVRPSGSSY